MARAAMLVPSKQANRPRWSGRGFEIWFFVVLVPGRARALWVRLTRFRDDDREDARIWAVLSEGETVTATRELLPIAALRVEAEAVRVGEDTELGHGFTRGRCENLAWSLQFDASDPLVDRLPWVPGFVPLGTRSTHPHAEARVHGWVELDGERLSLDGGLLTQMHLWGTRRLEWLRWVWAPRFEGRAEDTELELTAVAPNAAGPSACSLWARIGGVSHDHTNLLAAAHAEVRSLRPGVLHQVVTRATRRLVTRAWAPPESFAGWDYRKPGGGALHVAQSNRATVELEVYRRIGLGWRPVERLTSTCAAVEFHGLDAHPEFHYVGWDAAVTRPRPTPASVAALGPAPTPGTFVETPPPTRIVALGLTYAAHARETASAPEAVVFEIDPSAWSTGDGVVVRPSDAQLRATLGKLDPRLPTLLAEFGFIPAMLDYEVELGLVLLDGLDDPRAPGRVGLVVANDLTARTLQVLGEGQRNRLSYWRAAKSFPGFAPTSVHAFVPDQFALDRWPALTLETRVNGEVRQRASTTQLLETPSEMLARVRTSVGPLAPGTLLLTGTPAGIALSIPRWKRALGERLLDRVGRLEAALGGFSSGSAFLRPGDRVEVSAGFLGGFARVVEIAG